MRLTAAIDSESKYRSTAFRTVRIVGASLVVDVFLLGLYALIGQISFALAAAYAGFSMAFCATLFSLMASGRAAAMGDPAATRFQLPTIVLIQLAGLLVAPQIGIFFLLSLFLVFSFAALTMTVKQAVMALFGICAMVSVCLLGFGIQPVVPVDTLGERVVTCVVFSLTLTRMVLLAAHSSRQRKLLSDRNRKLAESLARVEKMAITDGLTGVFNRSWIVTAMDQERERVRRHGGTFTVAVLDIDHFKQVNDQFGHLIGDQVLKVFADLVKAELRQTDHVARVGGEEFLVLLGQTPHASAIPVLERVRQRVADHPWSSVHDGLTVTVSIGVACHSADDAPDTLWARADAALYAAKSAGRNCIRPCLSTEAVHALG